MMNVKKRIKLILAIVLFFAFQEAKSLGKASVIVNVLNCHGNGRLLSNLKILKDGEEFQLIPAENNSELTIENLEIGSYLFLYKSFFGNEDSISLEIKDNKTYSLDICMYTLGYNKINCRPMIDQLLDEKKYTITVSSSGCFHSEEPYTISIIRKMNRYFIEFGDKKKVLTIKELEVIRDFECQLENLPDYGCTNVTTYVISCNNSTITRNDYTCEWNGPYYLVKSIFESK